MITLISVFGISLFLSLLMVAYRSYELSNNKEFVPRHKFEKFDNKILTFYDKNIILGDRLIKNLRDLPKTSSHKIHDAWEFVSGKVDTYFEKVKRSKTENNKGSVSIYWKSVSEGKTGRGEINE